MTRFPPLLRPMLLLALAAMLLAVAAPAVSRVLSAAGGQAAPGLVEMCTTGGLRQLAFDMGLDGPRDPAPAPQPSMDEACGYCTLPPPAPVATAAAVAPPHWHASSAIPAHAISPTRTWRNRHGLGARAPPVSP